MDNVLSGITPSGKLTLGNYIGAIKQFMEMQDKYEMYVFVANLHAFTSARVKEEIEENTKNLVAFYLAAGLDYNKTTIFLQSDVAAHSQLAWIMQCYSYMGELSRMVQYKEKSIKQNENIRVSLFTYPTLMAADILLYDPKYVPVGEDQTQHVELTRDIAERFNSTYGKTFKVPEVLINKEGARIMSLSDPTKKMSKSDDASDKGCIYLLDDEKTIIKKIKSATTDSVGKVNYDVKNQPGISNLLTIYSKIENITVKEAQAKFKDYSYADFKNEIAICVCKEIKMLQEKYQYVIDNDLVRKALKIGADKASIVANKKYELVKEKLGLNLKV